jgi:hypothetical protein
LAIWLSITAFVSADEVLWNADASGSWSMDDFWSPEPPDGADDVLIDRPTASVTVSLASDNRSVNKIVCNESLALSGGSLAVASLMRINGSCSLSGGTLGGYGSVEIAGSMGWTGGSIACRSSAIVAAGGNLSIDGASARYLDGASILNAGTITQNGSGYLYCRGTDVTINNLRRGIYDCLGNITIANSADSSGIFNNAGLFRKSVGAGPAKIVWFFNNSGKIDVRSGAVQLFGGGRHAGNYSIGPLGILEFSQKTNEFHDCNFDNAGTLLFSGGTAEFHVPVVIPGKTKIGGEATLAGTGEVTFENLAWSGGTIAGKVSIPAGGTATIGNGSLVRYLDGGTLSNAGDIAWNGSNTVAARGNFARIENLKGGIIDWLGDSSLLTSGGSGHQVINDGVFRKSGGNGKSAIEWDFLNDGSLEVQSGTLEFRRPISGTGSIVVSGKNAKLTAPSIVQDSLIIGGNLQAAAMEQTNHVIEVPEPSVLTLLVFACLLLGGRCFAIFSR